MGCDHMANYYQIYYGTKRNVANQACQPLPFSKEGVMKTNFQLEDLDFITCGYRDESAMILDLCQNPIYENIFTSFKEEHLFLAHKYKVYKGKLSLKEPLYGDSFLQKCSQYVQQQKKQGYYDKDILLPMTSQLESICTRLKSTVMNDDTGYFLYTREMDYMLQKELQSYLQLRQKENLTLAYVQDLNDIEQCIQRRLMHYKTLRKVLVCEKKYQQKQQQKVLEDDIQLSLFPKMLESSEEMLDFKYREIQNEELNYWYQEGGTSAIMEHMDGDSIYSCSKEDLILAGVFPPDYQEEGVKKIYEKKK